MRLPAWMIVLGSIALLCVSAGIGLVVVSARSQHVLVREDYYREGLKLDAQRAREAALDSLGISLSVRTEGRTLLVEASGPGATDAAVRKTLTAHSLVLQLRRPEESASDQDAPLTLVSETPMLWAAHLDLKQGHWDALAVFSDSAGARFEKALTLTETD